MQACCLKTARPPTAASQQGGSSCIAYAYTEHDHHNMRATAMLAPAGLAALVPALQYELRRLQDALGCTRLAAPPPSICSPALERLHHAQREDTRLLVRDYAGRPTPQLCCTACTTTTCCAYGASAKKTVSTEQQYPVPRHEAAACKASTRLQCSI
jgi:hypothetical protein